MAKSSKSSRSARTERQKVIEEMRAQQKAAERRRGGMIVAGSVVVALGIIVAAAWGPVTDHFKQQKYGVVLNVASTGGVSPRPNLTWYNASKGWVITATRAMAVELAPFGIRVNAINPVAGETPLLKTFMGQDTPEIRAKFLSTIPIGRFSTPEDMGNAAAFLCSDEASMITGVAMEVDGGRCI